MKKIKNILILAGGESSRFWPLSDKSVFNFCGKPLLACTIETLSPFAENIFVIVNNHNKQRASELTIQSGAKLIKQEGTGQSGALMSAQGHLTGPTLIINNNDLYDVSLIDAVLEAVEKKQPEILLTSTKVEHYFPGGYLVCHDDKVDDIVEKPGADNMPSPYFRLVVDYVANIEEFITIVKQTGSDSEIGYEEAIARYIKNGKDVRFVGYEGSWATFKYPWHLLAASQFFLSKIMHHRGEGVEIDKTAIIEGDVYIEDGVKIFEYAKIVGPAYIGKNTVIGNYALVVNSMIGENCVIGGYSEVTRSYLGEHVLLHRNYIGDSVLENNILFGAGALCANFRFDEKTVRSLVKEEMIDTGLTKLGAIIGSNVKVGVNTSLMPGVKIETGTRVEPGIVVKKDVRS